MTNKVIYIRHFGDYVRRTPRGIASQPTEWNVENITGKYGKPNDQYNQTCL